RPGEEGDRLRHQADGDLRPRVGARHQELRADRTKVRGTTGGTGVPGPVARVGEHPPLQVQSCLITLVVRSERGVFTPGVTCWFLSTRPTAPAGRRTAGRTRDQPPTHAWSRPP